MDHDSNFNVGRPKTKRVKTEKHVNGIQEQFRVVITKEANDHLENALEKVNKNFEGVAVTRSDLANHLFGNLTKLLSESDIRQLRSQHFDERRALSSMLKPNNDLPEEVRRALREFYGVSERDRKRVPRSTGDLPESSVDSVKPL